MLEKELILKLIRLNIRDYHLYSNDLNVLVGSSLLQCSFYNIERGGLWNRITYFKVAPEPDNLLVMSFVDQGQDACGTVFEAHV